MEKEELSQSREIVEENGDLVVERYLSVCIEKERYRMERIEGEFHSEQDICRN